MADLREVDALLAVERAARQLLDCRDTPCMCEPGLTCSACVLTKTLAALDKVRNDATERDAKCVHAFQERLPSGEILASCGLTVPYAEVCLGRSGIRCHGCQESYRGKYCPGGHLGINCLPSCWGYWMSGEIKPKDGPDA